MDTAFVEVFDFEIILVERLKRERNRIAVKKQKKFSVCF